MTRKISEIKVEKFIGNQNFESWSLPEIVKKFSEERLIVPEFQRNDIWDNAKKSRLIESILRDIPIPAIYLEKENDEKYIVIDGQQRIRAIVQYLNNEFKLVGLSKLEELKNLKYNNLKGNNYF